MHPARGAARRRVQPRRDADRNRTGLNPLCRRVPNQSATASKRWGRYYGNAWRLQVPLLATRPRDHLSHALGVRVPKDTSRALPRSRTGTTLPLTGPLQEDHRSSRERLRQDNPNGSDSPGRWLRTHIGSGSGCERRSAGPSGVEPDLPPGATHRQCLHRAGPLRRAAYRPSWSFWRRPLQCDVRAERPPLPLQPALSAHRWRPDGRWALGPVPGCLEASDSGWTTALPLRGRSPHRLPGVAGDAWFPTDHPACSERGTRTLPPAAVRNTARSCADAGTLSSFPPKPIVFIRSDHERPVTRFSRTCTPPTPNLVPPGELVTAPTGRGPVRGAALNRSALPGYSAPLCQAWVRRSPPNNRLGWGLRRRCTARSWTGVSGLSTGALPLSYSASALPLRESIPSGARLTRSCANPAGLSGIHSRGYL